VRAEATAPGEPAPPATGIWEKTTQGTKTKATKGTQTQADANGKPAKLSALASAAKLLGETGQALSCPDLIGPMAAQGYWTSPGGKTPAARLYSALLRELQTKGDKTRFIKAARASSQSGGPKGWSDERLGATPRLRDPDAGAFDRW
jgi:hypothetical protein